MKRITAVVNVHAMNNWDCLGQGVILGNNEYEVIFHRDPRMSIIDGKVKFNFDVVITDGKLEIEGVGLENLVPANRRHTIKRYNKIEQQTRLLACVDLNIADGEAEEFIFENFQPVIMHYQRQSSGLSCLVDPSNLVVVKPIDGARGIGQFLVDPSKIPLAVVVDVLDRFRNDRIEAKDVLSALRKYDPELKYSTAGENSEHEGLLAIYSQGFCIQDYIPNIKAEYRLITGYGDSPTYCQKRTVRAADATNFAQATGSETNSAKGDDICDVEHVLKGADYEGLMEFIKTVIGPLSSVDLFVTEDGKWGIFEYCNQFGIKGVPIKTVQRMHKDVLLGLIKKAQL